MRNFLIITILIAGMALLIVGEADAQCAMCKAVVESNSNTGENDIGKGINSGILYLMGIPYLLLMALAIIFFKKPISEKLKSLRS